MDQTKSRGDDAAPLAGAAAAADSLVRQLLDRLDAIDTRLCNMESRLRTNGAADLLPPGESLPGLLATLTDTLDDAQRRLASRGVDVDDRARRALGLIEALTRPETLDSLGRMVGLLRDLPGLLATAVDTLDDEARRAADSGIDLDRGLRQGVRAALRLAQSFGEREIDRLTEFLDSNVLHPAALRTVGDAGCALAEARGSAPPRIGLFGLLAALRDPAVQRAVGFMVQVGRAFGATVAQPVANETPCETRVQR